jgi:hypothetical protein
MGLRVLFSFCSFVVLDTHTRIHQPIQNGEGGGIVDLIEATFQ